jgi:hypothetical protein
MGKKIRLRNILCLKLQSLSLNFYQILRHKADLKIKRK